MSVSKTITRTKVVSTNSKAVSLSAALVEGVNGWYVNVYETITKDDANTTTQLVGRFSITPTVAGRNITFTAGYELYPGNATEAVTNGVTVPPSSEASVVGTLGITPSVNYDEFLDLAGDAINVTVDNY